MVTLTEIPTTTHEKVVKVTDDATGLIAFIAVHNSAIGHANGGLGISLGGLRIWPYENETAALTDALRLSEGMTNKSAVADDGCGGAKAVIMADPKTFTPEARKELIRSMGRAIQQFNLQYPKSRYVTAEDVNTSPADMHTLKENTDGVSGIGHDQFDGNPSPFTAYGVLTTMKTTLGVETMVGKKVAISGMGNVGGALARMLIDEGAQVVIADIDAQRCERIKQHQPDAVTVVSPAEIHKQDVDVYAPCALGACLNDDTIPQIKASYIIGAANNQLAEPRHGKVLNQMGKIYIPDFVANSGGVIAVAMEVQACRNNAPLTAEMISNQVKSKIEASTRRILEIAKTKDIPHSAAGMELANERLAAAAKNTSWVDRTAKPNSNDLKIG